MSMIKFKSTDQYVQLTTVYFFSDHV